MWKQLHLNVSLKIAWQSWRSIHFTMFRFAVLWLPTNLWVLWPSKETWIQHQETYTRGSPVDGTGTPSCWWLNQPIWKICSSNWNISPGRDENKKYLKPPGSHGLKLLFYVSPVLTYLLGTISLIILWPWGKGYYNSGYRCGGQNLKYLYCCHTPK